jgi:hypothetical protein
MSEETMLLKTISSSSVREQAERQESQLDPARGIGNGSDSPGLTGEAAVGLFAQRRTIPAVLHGREIQNDSVSAAGARDCE